MTISNYLYLSKTIRKIHDNIRFFGGKKDDIDEKELKHAIDVLNEYADSLTKGELI